MQLWWDVLIIGDRLRSIIIIEAGFNLVNKIQFGCQFMHRVEESVMLPKEQCGLIPGNTFIEVAVFISILCNYIQNEI